uniref:RNA polymerase Rpb4/RPC9 core domain-containing protein n=1 Tax=Chenopodium quinoa TaxID=63459 RepID=A0A803LRQ1_CHEQI
MKLPQVVKSGKSLYGIHHSDMKEYMGTLAVVAALLATITFTAAFTVPGGYNNEKGTPIVAKTLAFQVFMISEALFSSTQNYYSLAALMAEKGGKGFSLGKGAVPLKGKDDDSTKLKKGRKVQFEDEELPKNSKCVMDCEAADILQGIQEQMIFLSRDPTVKLPVSFDKGLLYAKAGGRYSNPKAVRKALGTLKKYGVSDGEICVIANTCPENAEEAFALVPSLKMPSLCSMSKLHDMHQLHLPGLW